MEVCGEGWACIGPRAATKLNKDVFDKVASAIRKCWYGENNLGPDNIFIYEKMKRSWTQKSSSIPIYVIENRAEYIINDKKGTTLAYKSLKYLKTKQKKPNEIDQKKALVFFLTSPRKFRDEYLRFCKDRVWNNAEKMTKGMKLGDLKKFFFHALGQYGVNYGIEKIRPIQVFQNAIKTVVDYQRMLNPKCEMEYYYDFCKNPFGVRDQLQETCDYIEQNCLTPDNMAAPGWLLKLTMSILTTVAIYGYFEWTEQNKKNICELAMFNDVNIVLNANQSEQNVDDDDGDDDGDDDDDDDGDDDDDYDDYDSGDGLQSDRGKSRSPSRSRKSKPNNASISRKNKNKFQPNDRVRVLYGDKYYNGTVINVTNKKIDVEFDERNKNGEIQYAPIPKNQYYLVKKI